MGRYIFQFIFIVVVDKKITFCFSAFYIFLGKKPNIVSTEVICVSARKLLIIYFKLPCKCGFVVRKINVLEKEK